jgi:HK97 family phage major capsid protein
MTLTAIEKESIAGGFKAVAEKLTPLETAIEELKSVNVTTGKQLRRLLLMYAEGLGTTEGKSNRFWGSDEQAKEFGDLFLVAAKKKAAGEGVSYEGGVLVPEELATWIINKMGSYGKFRRNTLVIPLKSDRMTVPKVETDLTIYSPGEGKGISESDMAFSQVGLTMHKLGCLAKVSSELEDDSVLAIGEIVGLSMSRSMAKKEDEIAFVGDGTVDYFGMTGIAPALRKVDPVIANIKGLKVGTGNLWSELTLADFDDVISIMPDDSDDGAKWYVHRRFYFGVMYKLAQAAGIANFLDIISPNRQRFFLGYPIEFVAAMPSAEANSQICALLGDLTLGSYLGQRKQLTIDRSSDVYFANDQIGFRGIERIDINAYGVGDTTEAGAIVGLITAAS